MSKILYVNGKRVVIDEEKAYFPFTYTISDLENVNAIGIPQSKAFDIPRVPENDEIFGYIGEITRTSFNLDGNEKVGVSFNQTKKAYYELFQETELVSSGQVQITGITDNNYSIILFDTIADLLEQFGGNSDTDKFFLSSMDIIKANNTVFEITTDALNVYNLMNDSVDIVPVVNITDFETSDSNIRCLDGVNYLPINVTLPEEFTPIQARSIKNYEVEYAVPINTVIRSINTYQNLEKSTSNFEYIKIDTELIDLFNEVHLNCGKPKKSEIPYTENFTLNEWPEAFTFLTNTNPQVVSVAYPMNSDSVNIGKKNGNYSLDLNCDISITPYPTPFGPYITKYNNVTYALSSSVGVVPVNGNKIGELNLKITIAGFNGTTKKFETINIKKIIELLYNINTTVVPNGSGYPSVMNITDIFNISFDLYPELQSLEDITVNLLYDFENIFSNTSVFNDSPVWTNQVTILMNQGSGVFTTLSEVRTNDTINGKMIFPKVSIKDFIINTCKFFNLDIINSNNSLLIRPKRYARTNEILRIAKVNGVDVNLFNFDKLILSTEVTSYPLIEKYNKDTKQIYGQKTINTGYSIKQNIKEVTVDVGVPSLIIDTNKLAYDRFAGYFNSGRSRGKYGVTEGFDDKIVFGFLNKVTNDPIYITNDTYYEGGIWSSNEPNNYPSEIQFQKNNQLLVYTSSTNSFKFVESFSIYGQSIRVINFNTVSPYKFNGDKIVASLEMNKPKYNYAGITDDKYDDNVTLYDTYHKKILEDKYNVNTNILDVDIYVDSKLNFYNIYNVKGVNYIIAELPEYDPSTDGKIFEGVKLLKVNDVYAYGALDYYRVVTTPKLTFVGNVTSSINKLLGFNYDAFGSSSVSTDEFKLINNIFFNNSSVSVIYDSINDVTDVTQTNYVTFPVNKDYTNKFKLNNFYFKYITDYDLQQYYLNTPEEFSLIDESGAGIINEQILNKELFIKSGSKQITEAGIYDPIKTNLECIQSGGLYYWLLSAECILRLDNSIVSLNSLSKFKFDNIVIEAKEQVSDIDYTDFQWGHSDLLDVNYEYFSNGTLKFTFKAMLFQGSNYTGTLADNVRDMYVVPFPDSDYTVKISIDGTYDDYVDAENTSIINFGDIGSNLSYILDTFTGNNESLITLTASNFEVAYSYTK